MILIIVALVVGLSLLAFLLSKWISYVERSRPVPSKPKLNRIQAIAYLKRKAANKVTINNGT